MGDRHGIVRNLRRSAKLFLVKNVYSLLLILAYASGWFGVPVIASGGVTSLDDIGRLAHVGVAGCIIGRALYEGRLDLAAALAAANPTPNNAPRPS